MNYQTTAEGYAAGLADTEAQRQYDYWHQPAARDAVHAWKRAESDHAETSYWGVAHIRAMRAYWLGILRAVRLNEVDRWRGAGRALNG